NHIRGREPGRIAQLRHHRDQYGENRDEDPASFASQCAAFLRKRPWGLKIRASTTSEKTTRGEVAGFQTTATRPDTAPTRSPAQRVPATLPMPPRMTMANTRPTHSIA